MTTAVLSLAQSATSQCRLVGTWLQVTLYWRWTLRWRALGVACIAGWGRLTGLTRTNARRRRGVIFEACLAHLDPFTLYKDAPGIPSRTSPPT
eukprot:6188101-Pleurochrysis_carterae.AAC.1